MEPIRTTNKGEQRMVSAINITNVVVTGWIIKRSDGTHYARMFAKKDFILPDGEQRVHTEKREIKNIPTDWDLLKERLQIAARDLGIPRPLEFIRTEADTTQRRTSYAR
jgi:hypothetical protein